MPAVAAAEPTPTGLTVPSHPGRTLPSVRTVLAALTGALVLSSGAASAPAADPWVFGGLGTWTDIYDSSVYAQPEATAGRIAARGVKTVWAETANYRASADVVQPMRLGRFVEALHARGVRVVGWYLPGHVNHGLDIRRARALLAFRTASGQGFDGIALNIEGTKLRNVALGS